MLSFRHRRTEKHGMRSHGAHRARLQVEPLEDRSLPSVQVLATLGDPAAGPGDPAFLVNDFEPAGLNNHGEVLWGVDLTSVQGDPSFSFGEGIYLQNVEGGETRLATANALQSPYNSSVRAMSCQVYKSIIQEVERWPR
jgi:hypothetical protein